MHGPESTGTSVPSCARCVLSLIPHHRHLDPVVANPVFIPDARDSPLALPVALVRRRRLRALVELVGIEPNPGPKGGKAKSGKSARPAIRVVQPKMKGRGDYSLKAGTLSGSLLGKLGSWVGDSAQKALMSITGMGDYTVKSNSLVTGSQAVPVFGQNGRHSVTVCHREFSTLVTSPGGAFNCNTFVINPSSSLFPWLAQLAVDFELFRFRGLVVEFKATSATAVSSTNTALGSVILATQYNALAPPFTTQVAAEAYEFSTSTVAFTSCIHPIECAPSELGLSEMYTDLGYASGDPRFTILGVLNVMTVGQQAASTLGELWVSYEIDLIRPRLFGTIPSVGYTCRLSGNSALSGTDFFSAIAGNIAANNTGNITVPPASQTLDVKIGSPSVNGGQGNTITFPPGVFGNFFLWFYVSGTTPTTITGGTWSSNSLINVANDQLPNAVSLEQTPPNGVSSASMSQMLSFAINPGANGLGVNTPILTLNNSGAAYPASITNVYIQILQASS